MLLIRTICFMDRDELQRLIGKNIRRYRESLQWTQEELAVRAGLNRSYLGGIERGLRNISLSTIASLASALEIHPSDLFSTVSQGDKNEPKTSESG